jgi:hypothetical protein
MLQEMEKNGWGSLVVAIRRIIKGERNADALLQGLDEEDTLIAGAILAGIENPEAFRELLGPQHLSSRSTERAPAQFIASAGWFVFAQRCQPIYC